MQKKEKRRYNHRGTEIDHLVYKLYNLTDEEIAIIEKNK
jgi:hypothetical protein